MNRRQLLFGHHANWFAAIGSHLDLTRFRPSFAPLDRVDLDYFDAVFPLDFSHYHTLAAHPALRGRKFWAPAPATVALCHDKLQLAQFLIGQGFGAHVPQVLDGTRTYPLVRRPRRGNYGEGARIIRQRADDGAIRAFGGDMLDQIYIPGTEEFSFHALRVDGRILFSTAFRFDMAALFLIRGGANEPIRWTPIDPAPALSCFGPMLDALDYTGTCCIDYKMAGAGPMVMEINPRFGGTLVYDLDRYVDAYLGALA